MATNDLHFFTVLIIVWFVSLRSIAASDLASRSVLAALLESRNTEMMELVERAGMLQALEIAATHHNLTIFAPRNEVLELHFDSEFREFLLQPGNVKLLQRVVMFHVIPVRITASQWSNRSFRSLSDDQIHLHWKRRRFPAVERSVIDIPDMIVRRDGVAHRIRGLLIPKSVENVYAAARMKQSAAVLPQGAPVLSDDPGAPPSKLFHVAFPSAAPERISASASAPAPSPSSSDPFLIYGHSRVADLIAELIAYGGYNEIADLLVNLTSLASEIGKLVNEGHRLTVLAPNDEAIDLLTTEQLNAPGGIESMLTYHILPEYQTEESLYSLTKRNARIDFSTLRVPPAKLAATEIDGTVQFGLGKFAGLLLDPNIFTDDWISVQGISKVLMPPPPPTPKYTMTSVQGHMSNQTG